MKRCQRCDSRFNGASWQCPGCGFAPETEEGVAVFAPDLARTTVGYDSTLFDGHGGEEAERSFWTRARSALIVWALRHYAPGCRSFLEIGCGTGGVLRALEHAFPDMRLVGAEALTSGLHAARGRLRRASLIQLDAACIPYVNEFDAAGAFDVVEHIEDDRAVLGAMVDAIIPGGVLMVTVPQHPFLWGPADVSARHVRRYTADDLVGTVRALGLRVECVTSFVALLFPAMAAVRLLTRRRAVYDSAEEFRIGPLNPVFTLIMDAERWTIRWGARWPFGGSLLLVARKPSG